MTPLPKVRDVMATELITLAPETEINRALHSLLEHRISGAPVVDSDGWLVGVLSKKDCLKAALQASYYRDWEGTVAQYMSDKIKSLDPNMDLIAAAEAFVTSPYRRFPVLEEGRLVGQISRADVLRGLAESWD